MLKAAHSALTILRSRGGALDAVVAAVRTLEDDPLFNAGRGSALNALGAVEMDAAVMVAGSAAIPGSNDAGGVAIVSRVRNPILLARAVMEKSPHVLIAGAGAERFARQAGMTLCRPEEMVTARSRARWTAIVKRAENRASEHGTVGAVALDLNGGIAAATSTGGITGKLPGRIGDSPIPGAGLFAGAVGAASATGYGEAIITHALCRDAVEGLIVATPQKSARQSILQMARATSRDAGVILIDAQGRVGYAHNAAAMEVVSFDRRAGLVHRWVEPIGRTRQGSGSA
jgi:beta-aspartyl-peptidase (threonine type)